MPNLVLINKKEHYGALDGIRAYAAIGIVLMHVLANIAIKPSDNYLTNTIIPYFTNFTFLFMMVSAFSISCGYYEKIKNHIIAPNDFYVRRYKRILPFFAIIVFLDLVWERNFNSLCEGFADLTLCFGLYPNAEIKVIGVGWFIGLIFFFYMLYPFFTFLLDNKKRAWIVLLLTLLFCFIGLNYFGSKYYFQQPMEFTRTNIAYSAPYFVVGGLIYLYRKKLSECVHVHQWLMLAICIVITIAHFYYMDINLFIIPSLVFFASWLIYALGSKDIILNNSIVKYLSKISMEIYLCHMLFFRVVSMVHFEKFIANENLFYVITVICTLVGAIIFSHICKFWIINRISWLK